MTGKRANRPAPAAAIARTARAATDRAQPIRGDAGTPCIPHFLNKEDLSYNDLLSKNVSYVITTNEDGVIFDQGIEKLEYLKLINSFRYNIGDREFFANIFRFER